MTPRRRAGFTLIELLTVIAIIGIMSAALFPAIQGVRKKAKQSSATTAFSQWASGVSRYKQVYGFYPNIGPTVASYDSTKDSVHKLEEGANVKFVKALSGRQVTGERLTPTERKDFNRNGEEFCSFGKDDFEDPANLTPASRLVDRFGNLKIRVIFDTDNNTNISKIAGLAADSMPEDIRAITLTSGIPARVIIYTTDLLGDFDNVENSLDPSDYAQVLAIQ
jgi:prepilin-type N-terminal cleavage/methylation domain-containing protein